MIDILGFLLSWLTFLAIYTILSLSLNLEYGFAGQANFGKVAFYAIGGYTASVFSISLFLRVYGLGYALHELDTLIVMGKLVPKDPVLDVVSFVASLVLAFVISGAIGYLIAYPTLRVGPEFVGITILSFGELLRVFLSNYQTLGGPYGLGGIPNPFSWINDVVTKNVCYTVTVIVLSALIYLFLQRLVNSPYGRALKAVREDESASLSFGKNVQKLRSQVFFIGSGLAGIAGALYAHYATFVSPDNFIPSVTFDVWTIVILGGKGNNKGVVVGAILLTLVDRLTSVLYFLFPGFPIDPNFIRWMLMGLILVVALIFRPEGLLREGSTETIAWKVLAKFEGPEERKRPSLLNKVEGFLKGAITRIIKWFTMEGG